MKSTSTPIVEAPHGLAGKTPPLTRHGVHHHQLRIHNRAHRRHTDNAGALATTSASNHTRTLSSHHQGKRIFHREIGLIMLFVAAQTMAEIGNFSASVLSSTEVMADAYGFHERPSADAGEGYYSDEQFCYKTYTSIPTSKYVSFADPIDGALTSSATNSEEPEEGDDKDAEMESLSVLSTSLRHSHVSFLHDDGVWDNVMSFLPWRGVMRVRRVNRFFFRRSLNFAAILRMPHAKTPAVFIPCHVDLEANEAAAEAALRAVPMLSAAAASSSSTLCTEPWQCPHCHHWSAGKRTRCETNWCGQSRPVCPAVEAATKGAASSFPSGDAYTPSSSMPCRLFLGQLRRDGTVRMVEWLVNYVFDAPRGVLLSVENHRNANTGRGKGCAWPIIADNTTVNRLLDAQHRLFYDSVGGVEGVWFVPHGQESVLRTETSDPSRNGRSHRKYMPRGVMVFELPAGSQGMSQGNAPAATATDRCTSRTPFVAVPRSCSLALTQGARKPSSDGSCSGSSSVGAESASAQSAATATFRCPAPRSAQAAVTAMRNDEGSELQAATDCAELHDSGCSSSCGYGYSYGYGYDLNYVSHCPYVAESGREYLMPTTYRHQPYAPLMIFQM